MELTHKSLTEIALKWLKRPASAGGHGCQFAMSEVVSGWSGEIPDAIGFRTDHLGCSSVVVEVKVGRADFLRDKKKRHRQEDADALGHYRYYLCPEGLINLGDIPHKWGLLWVNKRGHIKAIRSPFISESYLEHQQYLHAMRFEPDRAREAFLMARLLTRLGDPEALNQQHKAIKREVLESSAAAEMWKKRCRDLSRENARLIRQLESTHLLQKTG